jgi:hypothetical protein
MWGCGTQAIMSNPIINTVFSETICQYRSDATILADNELRFSRTASPLLVALEPECRVTSRLFGKKDTSVVQLLRTDPQ